MIIKIAFEPNQSYFRSLRFSLLRARDGPVAVVFRSLLSRSVLQVDYFFISAR
jgi:hypothetical protein